MLVTAPAAASEVGTLRSDALRRRFEECGGFRFSEMLFLADDPSGDSFAVNYVGDEDDLAIMSRHPFAAKGNVVNREVRQAHGGNVRR